MRRIYLDHNSTTPLDPEVLDVIHQTLRDVWGNPSNSHDSGKKAKLVVERARMEIARMIKADAEDVIFASGGTEINNWVIQIALEYFHRFNQENDVKILNENETYGCIPHVITSNIEHDSITKPLEDLSYKGKLKVTFVPVNKQTMKIEVDDVINAIRPTTCLVTIMLANNETGVIQPVDKIFKEVKSLNKARQKICRILTHTDAAQAIGKIPVSVKQLQTDYLTIVGHKFYGPRIGALYCNKPGSTTPLYPIILGGGQEKNFRSGTENVGMIAGLGKASELVNENVDEYKHYFMMIREYLIYKLKTVFGYNIVINNDSRSFDVLPNTCSVSFPGTKANGQKLLSATKQIEASTGAACHSNGQVSHILVASGIKEELANCSIRLSVGRTTTKEDIDIAVKDLQQAYFSLAQNEI